MIGYKGFDKNMQCRGFQFEEGKEFVHEGDVKLCEEGFHFCENPLDIFTYYSPADSKIAEVVAEEVSPETESDSNRVCKKISIKGFLSLHTVVDLSVKFIFTKVDWKNAKESSTGDYSAATNTGYQSAATNTGKQSAAMNTGYQSAATNTGNRSAATNTGDYSAATNTGDLSTATNTGDYSAATNTGDYSASIVEGEESIAISLGIGGKAKASLCSFIVLAEWKGGHRVSVKSIQVDGESIKADTFYSLVDGLFIEVK